MSPVPLSSEIPVQWDPCPVRSLSSIRVLMLAHPKDASSSSSTKSAPKTRIGIPGSLQLTRGHFANCRGTRTDKNLSRLSGRFVSQRIWYTDKLTLFSPLVCTISITILDEDVVFDLLHLVKLRWLKLWRKYQKLFLYLSETKIWFIGKLDNIECDIFIFTFSWDSSGHSESIRLPLIELSLCTQKVAQVIPSKSRLLYCLLHPWLAGRPAEGAGVDYGLSGRRTVWVVTSGAQSSSEQLNPGASTPCSYPTLPPEHLLSLHWALWFIIYLHIHPSNVHCTCSSFPLLLTFC